jgi:hypothetical protein
MAALASFNRPAFEESTGDQLASILPRAREEIGRMGEEEFIDMVAFVLTSFVKRDVRFACVKTVQFMLHDDAAWEVWLRCESARIDAPRAQALVNDMPASYPCLSGWLASLLYYEFPDLCAELGLGGLPD